MYILSDSPGFSGEAVHISTNVWSKTVEAKTVEALRSAMRRQQNHNINAILIVVFFN